MVTNNYCLSIQLIMLELQDPRKNSQNNSRSHLSNKVKSHYSIESSNTNDMVKNNLLSCSYFINNNNLFMEIVDHLDSKYPKLHIKESAGTLSFNNSASLKRIFYTKEYKKTYEGDKPKITVKKSKISIFN